MLDEKTRALLGDREAQEAITARGELLPCPICGSVPRICKNWPRINEGHSGLEKDCEFFTAWSVECKCGEGKNGWVTQYRINSDGTVTQIGKRDGRAEAIKSWNQRPQILTPEHIKIEEAIDRIQKHMQRHGIDKFPGTDLTDALNMAIEALREDHFREVTKMIPLALEQLQETALDSGWHIPECGAKMDAET